MKLSQRLETIDSMIRKKYDHIWDCCCDHGLSGMTLLKRQAATTIHFVDIVEELMHNLRKKLQSFSTDIAPGTSWEVHCLDTAKLPLTSGESHLIIIAGVGGDLLIQFMQSILAAHPQHNLEFILCPVHHNYKVRQELRSMGLGLIDEYLVKENNRFYEIMHVSKTSVDPLSCVGSKMWNLSLKDHREFLDRTLGHYQRMLKNNNLDVANFFCDYQSLESTI
ncbi:MAG: tRNA (adenine(22)-N(1))-methyltransferase TrmK [Lentisphaeraceae bacterium]|nr:tRNA (adenine(22)-N(1))-methyltransferase TrmK [Lentisphaeraceae bacterium]